MPAVACSRCRHAPFSQSLPLPLAKPAAHPPAPAGAAVPALYRPHGGPLQVALGRRPCADPGHAALPGERATARVHLSLCSPEHVFRQRADLWLQALPPHSRPLDNSALPRPPLAYELSSLNGWMLECSQDPMARPVGTRVHRRLVAVITRFPNRLIVGQLAPRTPEDPSSCQSRMIVEGCQVFSRSARRGLHEHECVCCPDCKG